MNTKTSKALFFAFLSPLLILASCGKAPENSESRSEEASSLVASSTPASSEGSSAPLSSEASSVPLSSEVSSASLSSEASSASSSEEHIHTFSSEWSFNDTEHWHASTCGHMEEKADLGSHVFDEGRIGKEATYFEEGEKIYTCSVCQKEKKEVIPVLTGFFMPIYGAFTLSGSKDVVVEGTIFSGEVHVNDVLSLSNRESLSIKVLAIEKYRVSLESAKAGETVALKISGANKEWIKRGDTLFTPKSKKSSNQLKASLTLLGKEEGRKVPFSSGYKPQIYLYPRTTGSETQYATDETASIILPSDIELFIPGETHEVTLILKNPYVVTKGMEFVIREAGKTVGSGTILALEEHEHDGRYDEIGKCDICGFDQYLSFQYDETIERYFYTCDISVNERIFFKVTPKSSDSSKQWRFEAEGVNEAEDIEGKVYDVNGNDVETYLITGSTYIIVIECKVNQNNVTFRLVDSNDM